MHDGTVPRTAWKQGWLGFRLQFTLRFSAWQLARFGPMLPWSPPPGGFQVRSSAGVGTVGIGSDNNRRKMRASLYSCRKVIGLKW